jgi:DNA polymerase I-like protein with 3'-5' exonuclease and polymerase domains
MCDTHILSRIYNPDRLGHSLEWFGEKFGYPKGDHNDWTHLSQEMIDYCIRDVDLTEKVYEYLLLEGEGWDWSESIKLEYNIWHIQQKQETHGVLLDKKAAEILLGKIQQEIQQLEFEIQFELPLFPKDRGTLKKIFLKSGEYTEFVKEWMNGTV